MPKKSIAPGRQATYRSKFFSERVHDSYKSSRKLPSPTLCPECGAVFADGRWQWGPRPETAHRELCPACHRIHDHFPSGYVKLDGEFLAQHRAELIDLIRNVEKREKAEHPLERIIDIVDEDGGVMVSTADIHLAHGHRRSTAPRVQGHSGFALQPCGETAPRSVEPLTSQCWTTSRGIGLSITANHSTQRGHDSKIKETLMIIRTGMLFLAAALAIAAAQAQTPVAASQNGISYAAGGIGYDEMQQLQAREKEFNLKLVFTLVEGNYLSDVAVVVKDKSGKAVLVLDSPGPLVLARLPRGSYVVDATYHGKMQTRKVEVRDRLRTEYLRWPSNPETDFPGPKETER